MPRGDQDYRRHKRVTFTTHAALSLSPDSRKLIENVSTIDLSESGARIRVSGQIEPGQVVDLFLGIRPEQCRVVWTRPAVPQKELVAGLEFVCPLPEPRHRQNPPPNGFEPLN
jgi:hypothetical protein